MVFALEKNKVIKYLMIEIQFKVDLIFFFEFDSLWLFFINFGNLQNSRAGLNLLQLIENKIYWSLLKIICD
jgi:hypothetical protein